MKNRAAAKRVEKISAWRGRDGGGMVGGKEGGRGWTRRIQPKKKRTEKEKPERGGQGGNKKSNLFVI